MEKCKSDNRMKITRVFYLGALILTVLLLVIILFVRTSRNQEKTSDYRSINSEWTLSPLGSETADIKELGQYFEEGSDTISLYWHIPNIDGEETLIFRTKDVYCSVYVDGQLVYEPQIFESTLYNNSPGNNWNYVTFQPGDAGKKIELQIQYVYGTDAVTADNFIWGNKADWALDFVMHKAMAVLLSIGIIVIGLITITMNHGSYMRSGKHSLLYLGIYSVLMGMWSLTETNVIQIFMSDGRWIQLLNNLMMITDSIPLLFYLDEEFDILKNKVIRFLVTADIVYIYVCVIGQLLGLSDIHNFLAGSWLATGFSFIVLIIIFVRHIIALRRGEKIEAAVILQLIGFLSLMVLVIVCIPVYLNSDGIDRAESIRFGMLVMIVMFMIAGQLQTRELIKQGTRYALIKNLAYQDALTGLFNRTSFLEALDEYRNNPPESLGAIFFDVNNLKAANDNYGHETGDRLISIAADIISQSFADYGKTYRTGGDEFLVFLNGDDPEKNYHEGLDRFNKKIALMNEQHKYPFTIQIAHGFALCGEVTEENLKAMIENADARMYVNKKTMKGIES